MQFPTLVITVINTKACIAPGDQIGHLIAVEVFQLQVTVYCSDCVIRWKIFSISGTVTIVGVSRSAIIDKGLDLGRSFLEHNKIGYAIVVEIAHGKLGIVEASRESQAHFLTRRKHFPVGIRQVLQTLGSYIYSLYCKQ